ncbi:PREDICTED: keratin, type II cytoskeletal 1-like [Nelumbo nucifera]|uniref:Uncharacterized protein n=2 Tax=Nelumbo nucifera TaxID=4432 RepID=A0A822YHR2_NELNU|nr:PREDICTED: keratin, type II cytoskeletal 1-like [Nelumbo nucifera]DAD28998.1 TPA_asm: hypothetical protein HUJ06_030466 [Nelumbo nucifera]
MLAALLLIFLLLDGFPAGSSTSLNSGDEKRSDLQWFSWCHGGSRKEVAGKKGHFRCASSIVHEKMAVPYWVPRYTKARQRRPILHKPLLEPPVTNGRGSGYGSGVGSPILSPPPPPPIYGSGGGYSYGYGGGSGNDHYSYGNGYGGGGSGNGYGYDYGNGGGGGGYLLPPPPA